MPTIEINLTGGTYTHKSLPLSAQITRNWWPQLQDNASTKSPYILESFPALKLWTTTVGNADRGMLEHQGLLYKVTGTTLYSIASDKTVTTLGTIAGAARCILFGFGSSVVIVTDGSVYEWDGSLTLATDVDFETPNTGAHLNNQAIYDGDGGRFGVSNVGDPISNADNLLRVYVFDQIAYMLGEKTIEPWWNSGVGSPPFDRIEQGIIPIGLGAIHSVANDDQFMYILGDDSQVYAIKGSTPQVISTQAISRAISEYGTITDAIGWTMTLQGQSMYVLTFPTELRTWIYPAGGQWFEWSSGNTGSRSISNSYAFAYRKHLIGDYTTGNIYELDFNSYTNNGETIIRTRDTAPLHGGLFGAAGKKIEMSRFELILENGNGLISGQGSDPVIMLSFSDDGGRTFGTEMWGRTGKLGEYQWKVEWFVLGSFTERIIRVKTSDPVYYSIHSSATDIELGI